MIKETVKVSQFIRSGGELSLDSGACTDVIRSTLAKKADLRLKVRGSSMAPFIKDGDTVTLSGLPEGRIGAGWPIAFTHPINKKLVIHRLVKTRKRPHETYVTKGDGMENPDNPISRTDMLAYVKKVERNGKALPFGVGPERILIAYLSGHNQLKALFPFWRRVPYSIRQKIKG